MTNKRYNLFRHIFNIIIYSSEGGGEDYHNLYFPQKHDQDNQKQKLLLKKKVKRVDKQMEKRNRIWYDSNNFCLYP